MSDVVRPRYSRHEFLSSGPSVLGAVVLFVVALGLTRSYEPQIVAALQGHGSLGLAVFFGTTALAVVFPFFTNMPLVPIAVVLWGPGWTALILEFGWIAGSAVSFALARLLGRAAIQRFPLLTRYTDIDRLIHPSQPLLALVVLRMTFPVDILSFALGLFSARTTAAQNLLATAIGVMPFAILFAFLPTLSWPAQAALLVASALAFVFYAWWVLQAD
jgi:uncharacterized membrane protein YdjX (TVP38/TMEM64 family)